jgi:hypothetical protein
MVMSPAGLGRGGGMTVLPTAGSNLLDQTTPNTFLYIVTRWQKSRIEEAVVARQRHGKHVFTVTNQHTTIEEPFEAVFYTWSAPRLYG